MPSCSRSAASGGGELGAGDEQFLLEREDRRVEVGLVVRLAESAGDPRAEFASSIEP